MEEQSPKKGREQGAGDEESENDVGGGGGDTDQGQEKKVCKGEMVLHIENDCRRS